MKMHPLHRLLRAATLGGCLVLGAASAATGVPEWVKPGEVRAGDQYIGVTTFRHDGAIEGDLFLWAESAVCGGSIGGDLIGAGQDLGLTGAIGGDVRAAGKTIALSGKIGRNAMVAGLDVSFSRESSVAGSLVACGKTVVLDGQVRGKTRVFAEKIVLKGEFFGDVLVNVIDIDKKDREDWELKDALIVAPGAVLHGKLIYQGSSAELQPGAKVAAFEWIKTGEAPARWLSKENRRRVWGFVSFLFTTIALFLLGLALHRWFPALFMKLGEFSAQKPWSAVLYGLLAALSTVPSLVFFIVLLAMYLILSPGLGMLFGSIAGAAYLALYILSTVPVGLWLGNLAFRKNPSALNRFGLGLLLFNAAVYLLGLLAGYHVGGPLFSILSFIVKFAAVLFGAGALLFLVKEFFAAARRG
ncbi:MAG: hypothetical protein J0L75_11590 [Spirochaetes bacterium]|nr:hypothetical protein [Spirochaetota bacterium]